MGTDSAGQAAEEQVAEALAAEQESLSLECRAEPARLGRLLAADFHEFGALGGELGYQGTAELVAASTDPAGEPIRVENLRGQLLADGLVLVKYTSENQGRRANRTSLWRRVQPGRWQIFHHQGTVIPSSSRAGVRPDLKEELHRKLQASRGSLLSKLDSLSEYDRRRPLTPTGTNLLGLVKHLAGLEYLYLGESLGHPAPERLAWVEDGSIWQGADMWARADESSEYITGLYRRACAHADGVVAALDLAAPGSVAHWPQDRRETTLGVLLIRMVVETAQHAGHADIIRELIDGRGGPDQDDIDAAAWREYLAAIQAAASSFEPGSSAPPTF